MSDADDRPRERISMAEDAWDEAMADPDGVAGGEPDVLLDIPEVRVDEISLEVEDLHARVSLEADVLELLKLHVGVDAVLGRVQLTVKGVEAKVLLKVRLDNVARILDRVLTTIDNNPDIVERLTDQLGHAVEDLGGGAGRVVGDLGAVTGSAVQELGKEAGTAVEELSDGFEDATDEEAAPPRRDERDAEAQPRRRRTKSTSGRTRKTSRQARGRSSEES